MDEGGLSLNLSALDIGDGSNLDQHSVHDGHSESHQQGNENCNLIVNYLPHDIDDLALKGLFVEFGEIVMTKVVTDRNTKKSLGYGFVKFAREDDARMAIQRLNGFTIDHKCLKVSVARPPSLEIRNCKLYITNLPKDYSENDVIGLFQEFGEIIECRVLKDKNNRSNKGVAFVQFDNKTQANNALSLNGCQLEGSSRGLVVKYAEDQHKKREMTRLQNLTTHNVYRYMQPGAPMPYGDMMGDPHRGMQRPQDKPDPMGNAYYYPHSAPTHQHQQQHQQLPHHQVQHHMHASAPPPPPQAHHGLGGINAIFPGAAQQPLHHLQVPAVAVVGGGAMIGGGLPSPVMGSVSPNHFLYQQQQLLQQQQQQQLSGGVPPSLMAYSPGGLRSGGAGRGRKGPSYLEQIGPDPQQQYGNWYAPPSQQSSLAFLNSGGSSPLGLHTTTQGLYGQPSLQHQQQQRAMHAPQHQGMDVSGMGGLLGPGQGPRSPVMPQQHRSPLGGGSQSMQGYAPPPHHSPMMPQSHQSPLMAPQHQLTSPPQSVISPQQQLYGQPAMGHAAPLLHPSPYLSSSSAYNIEPPRRAPQGQHAPSQYPQGPHSSQGQFSQAPLPSQGPAMGAQSGAGSVTLNLSNLPAHADVAMLHDLFSPYGRILSAQIDVDVAATNNGGGMKGPAGGGGGGRVSVCSGRGQVQMAGLAQAENAAKGVSAKTRGSEYPIQVTIAGSGMYPQK